MARNAIGAITNNGHQTLRRIDLQYFTTPSNKKRLRGVAFTFFYLGEYYFNRSTLLLMKLVNSVPCNKP